MHIVRCGVQEQQAEAARIAGERRRLQQEQAAATVRLQAEQKKQIKEEQLRMKRVQQVCQVPHGFLPFLVASQPVCCLCLHVRLCIMSCIKS